MYVKLRRADAPVDPEFFKEAEELYRRYSQARFIDLATEIEKHLGEIEPVGAGKYAYADEISEALAKGYVPPSIFNSWRYCGRKVFLQVYNVAKQKKNIVSREQLRAIIRGLSIHDLYRRKYAVGETEVRLVSDNLKIYGIADEVRKDGSGSVTIIEVKSGYVRDPVGPALQVMAYMAVAKELYGLSDDEVDGYIISLSGAYRVLYDESVLMEYLKRVRTVIGAALAFANGDETAVERIPPRLPLRLISRCKSCPFAGQCQTLPDPTRNYDRYFSVMGFTKMKPQPQGTLMKFLGGGA